MTPRLIVRKENLTNMSANTINEAQEPSVWVIHGVNFEITIPLSPFNAQFDLETQAYEAGSHAMEVLKGKRDLEIKIDAGQEKANLGPVVIAQLYGSNPVKQILLETHVLLANGGFYKDSQAMEAVYNKEIKEAVELQAKEEARQLELQKSLKNFDKLKEEKGVPVAPKKRGRKPKNENFVDIRKKLS